VFLSVPGTTMIYPMICLASTIWSVDPYDTFKAAVLFLLYILSIAAICQVLDIRLFCKIIARVLAFLILASVVMAVAFPEYGKHHLLVGIPDGNIPDGTWRGVFIHKNLLGATACISVFTFVFFRRLMDVPFGFQLTCIVAAIACLLFAQSAGSLFATCVLLVYYYLVRYIPVSGRVLVLIVLGLSLLASAALLPFKEDLVAVLGRDATFTGRTYIWPIVQNAIWQNPLLGFGYFAATADFMRPLLVGQLGAAHAHDGYLDVLLGTGIVGLVSLLFCIGLVLVRGIDHVKTSARQEGDCFVLLLYFPIASLVFSFFEAFPLSDVLNVLGALTFLSLTAIPLYLRLDRGNYQSQPT
jgi:O-antigen ligase